MRSFTGPLPCGPGEGELQNSVIAYLQGVLLASADPRIVVGVGSSESMVGYALHCPVRPPYSELRLGQRVEFYVHTHVREDALELFGFLQVSERSLFYLLCQASGIGPKSALGLLSAASEQALVTMIATADHRALTALPGIGKRSAERLVVELRDVIQKKCDSGLWRAGSALTQPSASFTEAQTALEQLGFKTAEVLTVLGDLADPTLSAEEIIRGALPILGGKRRYTGPSARSPAANV